MTVEWNGDKVLNAAKIVLKDASWEIAKKVRDDAKRILRQKAKNKTERGLLEQFSIEESKFDKTTFVIWCQGPSKWWPPYHACVLGYDTYVKTDKGHAEIGHIKIGDSVIGQDGLPHKVNYTSNFLASEKPNMVELQVEFMKTKNHILKVTTDHKILTFKNGICYWTKAEDLTTNDFVFTAIKKAHNKGSGKIKICINCHQEYQEIMGNGQGKKYCSLECKWEHWGKGNNWHIGRKRSEETRLKMSRQKKAFLKLNPGKHINTILSQKGFQTDIEKKVESWLLMVGLQYKKQFKVGRHFVDFAIPSIGLLIEADGAYWHKDQARDIKRDKEILSNIPTATIIHIHFADKRFTPEINYNPIKNVYYIQCNDSMNSFINLEYFKPSKILELNHFQYKPKKGAGCYLYNLSVDDVHSFIASGIVVSNSFVELGAYSMEWGRYQKGSKEGAKIDPKPFMNPSRKKNKRGAKKIYQAALDKL